MTVLTRMAWPQTANMVPGTAAESSHLKLKTGSRVNLTWHKSLNSRSQTPVIDLFQQGHTFLAHTNRYTNWGPSFQMPENIGDMSPTMSAFR